MQTAKPRFEEIACKTVLNRVRGMDFGWSINPYKGCVHGCHYCFARRYHAFADLDAGADFTGLIFVKTNAPQVLRQELARPSWRRDPVTLGTATDPYQPIEGKYRLTRRILEALADHRTPVTIITKGTMMVRDVDILVRLARRAGVTVCHSITTLDPDAWRRLEPGTPPPWQRLRAMRILSDAGINAGVMLAPIVPGVTDTLENLETVVRAAAQHHARFLHGAVLRLQPGVKEHFLRFLQESYPGLLPQYGRMYPGVHSDSAYSGRIAAAVSGLKQRHGLLAPQPVVLLSPDPKPVQLPLAV